MKIKTIYSFLICTIALISCQNNEKGEGLDSMFLNADTIKTQQVYGNLNSVLLKPKNVVFSRNYIYVLEENNDTLITQYNKNDFVTKKFVTKGQAENEVVRVDAMGVNENDDLFVFDGVQKKIIVFDINGSYRLQRVNVNASNIVFSGTSYISQNICEDSDDGNGHFSYIDNDNNDTISFAPLKDTSLSTMTLSYILQGVMTVNNEKRMFFWSNSMGDYYEIYDYSDIHDITNVITQKISIPDTNGDTPVMTLNNHLGILSVASDNEYVYALYSGRTLEELLENNFDKDKALISNTILVYDWNGRPVRKIISNKQLSQLCYDKYDQILYAIEINENDEFCISKIL